MVQPELCVSERYFGTWGLHNNGPKGAGPEHLVAHLVLRPGGGFFFHGRKDVTPYCLLSFLIFLFLFACTCRYNMSELEEWLRSSKVYDSSMEDTLEPLVQIAQLLQVKKRTDDDVKLICDTCTKLTSTQVRPGQKKTNWAQFHGSAYCFSSSLFAYLASAKFLR